MIVDITFNNIKSEQFLRGYCKNMVAAAWGRKSGSKYRKKVH